MMDLGTGLKRIFLAGVGAIATTAEKSKELVDELVQKGELTVEQGKVLNEELKQNITEKVSKTAEIIQPHESASKIADRMEQMTPEELELLKAKLAEIEAAGTDNETENADE